MAIADRPPPAALIHHTDRGGQYASTRYRALLHRAAFRQSMNRADNCYSCYRWLASRLKGFEHAKPKQLSRKFIEASGEIEVLPHRILRVLFDRRCHNPILREAALDKAARPIPWLKGYRLKFDYR